MEQRIVTNLWFDTEAEKAAEFYVSVFDDSRVVSMARYPEGAEHAMRAMLEMKRIDIGALRRAADGVPAG